MVAIGSAVFDINDVGVVDVLVEDIGGFSLVYDAIADVDVSRDFHPAL